MKTLQIWKMQTPTTAMSSTAEGVRFHELVKNECLNVFSGSQSWEIGGDDTHTSDSVSDLPEEESPMEMCPLFLHLICSVQHNNGIIRQPISSLPTCLGNKLVFQNLTAMKYNFLTAEIDSLLSSGETEINISAMKVFLDVQCLTLVPNLEQLVQVAQKPVEPTPEQSTPNQTLEKSALNTSVSSSSSVTETE
jgi:hypothetical protein